MMTDVEDTSCVPGSTVIAREPQYIDSALVSGILAPPPRPPKPSGEPACAKDETAGPSQGQPSCEPARAKDETAGPSQAQPSCEPAPANDETAGPSHAQLLLRSQIYLTKIREQAVSHLQVQKNKHVKDLSEKKDKLQSLLCKLDSSTSSHASGPEGSSAEVPGALCTVMLAPEDKEEERTHDCSFKDNRSPTKVEDCLKHTLKRSRVAVELLSRTFFLALSLPLSLVSVVIIELMRFITGTLKVLVMGLVKAVGEDVLAPLLGALLNVICEPVMKFLHSVSVGIRDALRPLESVVIEIVHHMVSIIQAFRLVEINKLELPQQSIDL